MEAIYYHATTLDNAMCIYDSGCIKTGFDGIVYLCTTADEAMRFLRIRMQTDIVVFEVILNNEEVDETFDHSEAFFKCKAYGYPHNISLELCKSIKHYKFR